MWTNLRPVYCGPILDQFIVYKSWTSLLWTNLRPVYYNPILDQFIVNQVYCLQTRTGLFYTGLKPVFYIQAWNRFIVYRPETSLLCTLYTVQTRATSLKAWIKISNQFWTDFGRKLVSNLICWCQLKTSWLVRGSKIFWDQVRFKIETGEKLIK